MRVAYVCTDPGIPVFGTKGASVHVQAVLRVLVAAGAEVHLLCARTGGEPPPDLTPVRVHLLSRVRGVGTAEREKSAAASDAEVGALLDRLHAEEPLDLVYERYALWGRSATARAAATGVPSVLEVNAPLVEEQARHRDLVDREGAENVACAAISSAQATVCVTEPVASWARERAADATRVHVVANGVDTHRIRPADRPVVGPSGSFTLGFVGTLKPWHGVETLLKATALLVERDAAVQLLLVGAGPRADALADQARRLGISGHVETTGAVHPARIPALLQRMDLAVAPYPAQADFYFSPLKVYEYLAAGLPVVASDIGTLPALLAHGRLGTLVAPGSPQALADAIAALRADQDRRVALRHAARRAAEGHDWRHVVARTLATVGVRLEDGSRAA